MANLDTKQWQSFSQELAAVSEHVGRSVVTVHAPNRHSSSGVLWDQKIVVTADHALPRDGVIAVTLSPGRTVEATIGGRDHSTDLAVLKLSQAAAGPAAEFGGDASLRIGDYVLALARTQRGNLVASGGLISGLMGPWRARRGGEMDQFIRPDLNLYPGFSGGPLVNALAQVIGINSSALRRGSGITIPQTTIRRVVKELVEKGHIAQPYLGVAMQTVPVPESLRANQNVEGASCLLVMHVQPGGPGETAGLLLGDAVVRIAGQTATDTDDVQQILHSAEIGSQVEIQVLRGGERKAIVLTLAERPTGR